MNRKTASDILAGSVRVVRGATDARPNDCETVRTYPHRASLDGPGAIAIGCETCEESVILTDGQNNLAVSRMFAQEHRRCRFEIDALALCNSCDARPADPSDPGGYCRECVQGDCQREPVPLQFIGLRDTTGRVSSLQVEDGGLCVIGILPHGLTFRPRTERDRLALIAWLENLAMGDECQECGETWDGRRPEGSPCDACKLAAVADAQ